jgi:glycosyltransferase involved in cell wall biosynthesis
MKAFPLVLEKIPNARLIIAGANHHTKPGYWESIRAAQPSHLPIEFRGYVPEEDIPTLFATSSVLVLPYDSATGSSGPAHQACEYGLPIVSADLHDFRAMAADEDMAIRFYKLGDADDLSGQLVAILESEEMERAMAEHNFAAGLEMTMSNVVGNYLRWFELHRHKSKLLKSRKHNGRPSLNSQAEIAEFALMTAEGDEEVMAFSGIDSKRPPHEADRNDSRVSAIFQHVKKHQT